MSDELKPWERWDKRSRQTARRAYFTGTNGTVVHTAANQIEYVHKKVNRYAWDDCAINTMCILEERPWKEVFKEFSEIASALLVMPFNVPVIQKYMEEHRYPRVQANGTVAMFASAHPQGRFAIITPQQEFNDGSNLSDIMAAVIDGKVYGNFDARQWSAVTAYLVDDVKPLTDFHPTYVRKDTEAPKVEKRSYGVPGSIVNMIVNDYAGDDCVINSLCIATGRTWRDVFDECSELGYKYSRMQHSYRILTEFMNAHGYPRVYPGRGQGTVIAFVKGHTDGAYIMACRGHTTVSVNGIIYNTGWPLDGLRIMKAFKIK